MLERIGRIRDYVSALGKPPVVPVVTVDRMADIARRHGRLFDASQFEPIDAAGARAFGRQSGRQTGILQVWVFDDVRRYDGAKHMETRWIRWRLGRKKHVALAARAHPDMPHTKVVREIQTKLPAYMDFAQGKISRRQMNMYYEIDGSDHTQSGPAPKNYPATWWFRTLKKIQYKAGFFKARP